MDVWRDISTAPRDGTEILLTGQPLSTEDDYEQFCRCVVGFYDTGDWDDEHIWNCYHWDGDWRTYYEPTHWCPIPKPPITKIKEEK